MPPPLASCRGRCVWVSSEETNGAGPAQRFSFAEPFLNISMRVFGSKNLQSVQSDVVRMYLFLYKCLHGVSFCVQLRTMCEEHSNKIVRLIIITANNNFALMLFLECYKLVQHLLNILKAFSASLDKFRRR